MNNKFARLILLPVFLIAPVFAQGQPVPQGTGLYAAPTSGAYSLLANAANQMLNDIKTSVPSVQAVVLFDQGTFASVPYYPTAIEQIKAALRGLCVPGGPHALDLSSVGDLGTAASGLAAMIGVTLPTYSINGQAVTSIDTTALAGVFSSVARNNMITVVNPLYLLPAKIQSMTNCDNYSQSSSVATLWALAALEYSRLAASPGAGTDSAKTALAQFQKMSDVFLAADKGLPLLSKLLIVESLLSTVTDPAHTAVIDMKLDGAGIDSTTRSILWWRKTTISANVLAHYSVLKVALDSSKLALTLDRPGYANFMITGVNQSGFAATTNAAGLINGRAAVEHKK